MKGTPTCPNCGAKFAHNEALAACSKCGLPDEVAILGRQVILAWRDAELRNAGISKRQRKIIRRHLRAATGRRRMKHGRQVHVAR